MKNPSKAIISLSIGIFATLIVASNYLVQFPINTLLTYGALTYPFTFLLSDVLSEKYGKEYVLKIVRFGILIAFIPSLLLAEWQIALASVCAFFISQQFDVYAFFWIKSKFPNLWWLRTSLSTALSQMLDTLIFFHIAFLFNMPYNQIILLALGDYTIKFILAIVNTPFFYLFAIRMQKILRILN